MVCCLIDNASPFAVAESRGISRICLHLPLRQRRLRNPRHITRGILRPIRLMRRERLNLLAAAAAPPGFPDAALVFADEGPVPRAIEEAVTSQGLDGRGRPLEQREGVPALLAATSCLILASHEEGFPNASVEAMAHAFPVVVTTVGGNPEIDRDGVAGLLVPPRDPAALAKALASLPADPAAACRMGHMGRARAASHFSLERMLDESEALSDNPLGPRPASAAPGEGIATPSGAVPARGI